MSTQNTRFDHNFFMGYIDNRRTHRPIARKPDFQIQETKKRGKNYQNLNFEKMTQKQIFSLPYVGKRKWKKITAFCFPTEFVIANLTVFHFKQHLKILANERKYEIDPPPPPCITNKGTSMRKFRCHMWWIELGWKSGKGVGGSFAKWYEVTWRHRSPRCIQRGEGGADEELFLFSGEFYQSCRGMNLSWRRRGKIWRC